MSYDLLIIEDDSELQKEQDILDYQDEVSEDLILRLRIILESNQSSDTYAGIRAVKRMLKRLRTSLREVQVALKDLDGRPENLPAAQQYTEELLSDKEDLRHVSDELLRLGLEDDHELFELHTALRKMHFECSCATRVLKKQTSFSF